MRRPSGAGSSSAESRPSRAPAGGAGRRPGRPRATHEGPSARERLEVAFWELLAQRSFGELTVAALCRRARVNHNTFYYHFANLEELARHAFAQNMLPSLPRTILPLLARGATDALGEAASDAQVGAHFTRAMLFATSESTLLVGILRGAVMGLWLETVGLDRDRLTEAEHDQLQFIFGGLVSLLGATRGQATPVRIAAVLESPLGRGLFDTLAAMAARDRTTSG